MVGMKKPKKAIIAYVATGVFLLLGLTSIVLGYGLSSGWDAVIGWFTSRWAIYVYVFLFFYGIGIAWLLIWGRSNGKR